MLYPKKKERRTKPADIAYTYYIADEGPVSSVQRLEPPATAEPTETGRTHPSKHASPHHTIQLPTPGPPRSSEWTPSIDMGKVEQPGPPVVNFTSSPCPNPIHPKYP